MARYAATSFFVGLGSRQYTKMRKIGLTWGAALRFVRIVYVSERLKTSFPTSSSPNSFLPCPPKLKTIWEM